MSWIQIAYQRNKEQKKCLNLVKRINQNNDRLQLERTNNNSRIHEITESAEQPDENCVIIFSIWRGFR